VSANRAANPGSITPPSHTFIMANLMEFANRSTTSPRVRNPAIGGISRQIKTHHCAKRSFKPEGLTVVRCPPGRAFKSYAKHGGHRPSHTSNTSLSCDTCPLQEQKNIQQGMSNTEGNGLRCQDRSSVDNEKESVPVSTAFRVFWRLLVATD
jgi:hypothetical protein